MTRPRPASAGRSAPRATPTPSRWAPLSEEEVWQLVREMGHVSVPTGGRRLAARLHRITAGNPFYVIELLKTMFAQGLLSMDAETGEWTVVPSEVGAGREVPVSQTVQDVIAERVDRLSTDLRDVLITIAVSGGGCRPDVLSHVHGISRLRAASAGDALVDRYLVAEEGGGYRCIHPVIAHMVRDGLTASRRQEVHRVDRAGPRAGRWRETSWSRPLGRSPATRSGEASGTWRIATRDARPKARRRAMPTPRRSRWLDLAASSARGPVQAQAVDQLTAEVMERAGWSEAPRRATAPVTREIVSEDFDLRVRG